MRSRQARITCRVLMLDERRDLRALLQGLRPQQWDQESLCSDWSVKDLVAHMLAWDELLLYRTRREHLRGLLRFGARYAASLASMDKLNRRLQTTTGHLTVDQLLQRFAHDDTPDLRWLFDGSNPAAHHAEYVIHHQDIRRPLGLPRHVPADRLVAALDGVTKLPGVRISAWRQLRQRRWEATDVDWRAGRGSDVVRAPGEDILMALARR
jgi:uncharacterized protein (TIGR03083 family)